jgi:hypothetical protein
MNSSRYLIFYRKTLLADRMNLMRSTNTLTTADIFLHSIVLLTEPQ